MIKFYFNTNIIFTAYYFAVNLLKKKIDAYYHNLLKLLSGQKTTGKHITINYYLAGKRYKMLLKSSLPKPKVVDIVLDEYNNDITHIFDEYHGPKRDFHGSILTPKDLGFKKLAIRFKYTDRIQTFDETENIIIL